MFKEKEYDAATLLEDVSQGDDATKAGETGTIVRLYPSVDAFTVEFNHGVVYKCDPLNFRPHQARLAAKEDIEIEKRRKMSQTVAD